MFTLISLTVIAILSTILGDAQITIERCPVEKLMKGLNLEKMMGTWYDIKRTYTYSSAMYQCTVANFTLQDNGTIEIMQKSNVYLSLLSGDQKGAANPVSPDKPAKWVITSDSPLLASEWDVVDTDYDNYAITWHCKSLDSSPYSDRYLWVMARERYPSDQVLEVVDEKLKALGFSTTFLRDVRSRFFCPKQIGYEIFSL